MELSYRVVSDLTYHWGPYSKRIFSVKISTGKSWADAYGFLLVSKIGDGEVDKSNH